MIHQTSIPLVHRSPIVVCNICADALRMNARDEVRRTDQANRITLRLTLHSGRIESLYTSVRCRTASAAGIVYVCVCVCVWVCVDRGHDRDDMLDTSAHM